ncbi:sigma-70 family RNA polymerase sigma factor [Pseudomonas sp. 3A(2025)]
MAIRSNTAGIAGEPPEPAAQDILLQACATGNRLAFEALYRATSSRLFGICLHYLGNRAEAEEVLQEVYTTAWLKASGFDPQRASAMTWLATIARHKAIDQRRSRRNHEPLEWLAEWPAQDTVVDSFERERQGSQIDRCLATLAEDQQRYIRVAFFEGYSYAELAESASIPLGTMKSWIRRALLRLRGCLGL